MLAISRDEWLTGKSKICEDMKMNVTEKELLKSGAADSSSLVKHRKAIIAFPGLFEKEKSASFDLQSSFSETIIFICSA